VSDAPQKPPPSPEEQAAAAQAQMVGFVMHMAGVDQAKAVKALEMSWGMERQLGPYLEALIETDARAENPTMGVRIHWPDQKTYTDFPTWKVLQHEGPLSSDVGQDIGVYLMTIAAVTSPIARAVLMAQGYRLEFIQGPAPKHPLLM